MNAELHHKWNAERDGTRDSSRPAAVDPKEAVHGNKVLLKQNKPR